jgi:hypothetical protein
MTEKKPAKLPLPSGPSGIQRQLVRLQKVVRQGKRPITDTVTEAAKPKARVKKRALKRGGKK